MLETTTWALNKEDLELLAQRIQNNPHALNDTSEDEEEGAETRLLTKESGIGTIPVQGMITNTRSLHTLLGAATTTMDINESLDEAETSDDVQMVLLDIDSPGGKATAVPSVAKKIRDMDTNVVSYASGQMLSAAYWIGSAADRVIGSPNAMVGSIGVYSMLMSVSEMQEELGIETKIIRSTEKKAAGHPSEPISDESVKKAQSIVDKTHDNFVKAVAKNRNLSQEFVRNNMANADVKVGDDAEPDYTDETLTLDGLFETFSFDEDSELSREEQENNFLRAKVGELQEEKENLENRVEVLEDKFTEMQEHNEETRIDEIVTQAIEEDQKFAPAKADELRERLSEDFEGTKKMIEMTPEGAAGPSDPVDTPEVEEDVSEKVDALQSKGLIPAHTEEEAEYLDKLGTEYVGNNIESADWFRADNVENL
jgi:signal peptide peptidase SppA